MRSNGCKISALVFVLVRVNCDEFMQDLVGA